MNLQRTFSTLGCPDLTLEQAFELAAKHGLAGIELRALGGTLELPGYFAQTYGRPPALAAKLRGQPVRIVALDTSLKLIGGTAADREKFLAFVPWAEALGVPRLRVFDGGAKLDAAELARAADTMSWWRELRRKNGWRADLMVETHDSLFTAAAIERFGAVAPDVRILWDTHHTWKQGGEDPVATWRKIKARVVHVHVKDSVSQPGARHSQTYVLPGNGEFPMAPLLGALRADGYTGPLSLEWEKLWHPGLPSLDDALRAAAERDWW